MSVQIHIPTLKTERLTLRPPRTEDFDAYSTFMTSERATFVGGPYDLINASRSWGNLAGMWVLRGYGSFVACLADGTAIGSMGCWHPLIWPEHEFGWSLWSLKYEGKGYVTEALRAIMPWAWPIMKVETAVSYVSANNQRSANVAMALGASFDPVASAELNKPGSIFYNPDKADVHVYRHQKEAA